MFLAPGPEVILELVSKSGPILPFHSTELVSSLVSQFSFPVNQIVSEFSFLHLHKVLGFLDVTGIDRVPGV